jgi:hypothetical protein
MLLGLLLDTAQPYMIGGRPTIQELNCPFNEDRHASVTANQRCPKDSSLPGPRPNNGIRRCSQDLPECLDDCSGDNALADSTSNAAHVAQ